MMAVRAISLAVSVCLFVATGARADPAPADCRLILLTSLDATTEEDGRVSVPVTVNDLPLSMLFDTGGAYSSISSSIADSVSQQRNNTGLYLSGVGGNMMNSFITSKSFSIGGLNGKGFMFFVDNRGISQDGILAPDAFAHFDVEVDFVKSKVNFFSQDRCPGQAVYWPHAVAAAIPMEMAQGHIRIPIKIDGREMHAIVDTGAQYSVMALRVASNMLDIDEKSPGMVAESRGNYIRYHYPFKSLTMEGVTVGNPAIRVMSNNYMGVANKDLILGMDILRQLHLYIGYKEKMLYVTPAE